MSSSVSPAQAFKNEISAGFGGDYVVFSSARIKELARGDNPQFSSFPFRNLLAICAFFDASVAWRSNANTTKPHAQFDQRAVFSFEIIERRFKAAKHEFLVSVDLIPELSAQEAVVDPKLLQKSIFVAKSVFDSKREGKFYLEVATSQGKTRHESSRLNKIVDTLTKFVAANEQINKEDPEAAKEPILYRIGRVD
ncbi:MAG: hypothetical protein JSS32_01760 [Verrucomicrobia bacterium]|nr:hypothetical protein [Verrucomicrobiota bacterium]